jgi:Family of unknown function (DUF6283)
VKKKARVTRVRQAGKNHAVVTVVGGAGTFRTTPCPECPWRKDQTGKFPAKAFEHSAETAYDMSGESFACHMAGREKPQTCAGFLLRGADHNLSVRLKFRRAQADIVSDGGHELHEGYVSMAVANGMRPNHPRLRPCRLSYVEEEKRR